MTRFPAWAVLAILACHAADVWAELPRQARGAAEIQQAVRDVLSDPEYRHLPRDPDRKSEGRTEADWPEWLRDFFKWLFGSDSKNAGMIEAPSGSSALLFYVVVGILAAVLIVLVVSVWKRGGAGASQDSFFSSEPEEAINPSRPPGDVPTHEYERRALAAAQSGDYRLALRELVLGAMSWTERAGLIRYRRGLTNRDYIRAAWRNGDRRESLLQIVAAFERVFYGRRFADACTFEACLLEFQRSFLLEINDAPPAS